MAAPENRTADAVIRDTGPAIPRELLDGIFDLKFAPKRERMSFGLGLPTARRIVERHGGTLSVSSVVGEGTEFVMSVPIER